MMSATRRLDVAHAWSGLANFIIGSHSGKQNANSTKRKTGLAEL
jgi:hypothetical protein